MFLEAALLGIIAGAFNGGRLKNLNRINLRGWPLALVALLIQLGLRVDPGIHWSSRLSELTPHLHLLSYLPLLLFVYINRKLPGMNIFGLGLLLNLLVIAANGGAMPVDANQLSPLSREGLLSGTKSPLHIPIDPTTRFSFLGDILRVPYGNHRMISAGDILLSVGLFLFLYWSMHKPRPAKRKGKH